MKYLLTLGTLLLCMAPIGAQTTSLRDAVLKENGPVAIVETDSWPPVTLRELLVDADLVVRGVLDHPVAYLSEDGSTILTDYVVQAAQVLFSAIPTRRPGPAETITLTLPGGTMILEGHQVTVHRADLQQSLKTGTEGVFILVRQGNKYELAKKSLGAFGIEKEAVVSVTSSGGLGRYRGKPASEFLAEIASILRDLKR